MEHHKQRPETGVTTVKADATTIVMVRWLCYTIDAYYYIHNIACIYNDYCTVNFTCIVLYFYVSYLYMSCIQPEVRVDSVGCLHINQTVYKVCVCTPLYICVYKFTYIHSRLSCLYLVYIFYYMLYL